MTAVPVARVKTLTASAEIRCLSYSRCGTRLVAGCADKTAWLWDAPSTTALRHLAVHDDSVEGAALAPDGTVLATASADKTIRLWDAVTGDRIAQRRACHKGAIRCLVYSDDGACIATGSADGSIVVWCSKSLAPLHSLTGHDGPIRSVRFSADGASLLTSSDDGTAQVWLVAQQARLVRFAAHESGPVRAAVYSPCETFVATGSDDAAVRVWLAETGEELKCMQLDAAAMTGVEGPPSARSVAYSPCGMFIAAGYTDAHVRVWGAKSRLLLRDFEGHLDWVTAVAYSPSGAVVASASDDATVRLWSPPMPPVRSADPEAAAASPPREASGVAATPSRARPQRDDAVVGPPADADKIAALEAMLAEAQRRADAAESQLAARDIE